MANFTGQHGSLSINGTAVANLKSFSVDYTINSVESTVMGDTTRQYRGSIREWSGSADIYYDVTDTTALMAAIDAAEGSVTGVAFIGYPSSEDTGAPKLSGNIIITGYSTNTTLEGMVEGSISFQGTGDLTFGTAV